MYKGLSPSDPTETMPCPERAVVFHAGESGQIKPLELMQATPGEQPEYLFPLGEKPPSGFVRLPFVLLKS